MQRIWWLNSTLCAKVHLMTFGLYNYQTPRWPDCRLSKNAQETLGYQKIIVPKIPPGEGGYCQLKVYWAYWGFVIVKVNLHHSQNHGRLKISLCGLVAMKSLLRCFYLKTLLSFQSMTSENLCEPSPILAPLGKILCELRRLWRHGSHAPEHSTIGIDRILKICLAVLIQHR